MNWISLLVFSLLNFGGLGIGGFFTGKGTVSDWYSNLDKAPWTPPGWVFGFAWTVIMIAYSIYMAKLWGESHNKTKLAIVYSIALILNVLWNPVFFYFQMPLIGLIVIVGLFISILLITLSYKQELSYWSLLTLPYIIWLAIAISLNAYIVVRN